MKNTLNILIVEDSEDDALLEIIQLQKGGYDVDYKRVDTSEDLRSALSLDKWDLILSDYQMPNFNGIEALSIVREFEKDIPFIIISGIIGEDVAVKAMKAGAHDYIMKDNLRRLLPAVEREIREANNRAKQRRLEHKEKLLLEERFSHYKFLESMDKINRAIQGTSELENMMSEVLDVVLTVFESDRAYLLYPNDPETKSWQIPMEKTKPEYPGILEKRIEIPIDEDVTETFRILLDAEGPHMFGPGTKNPMPQNMAEQYKIKNFMAMAIYPKTGKPWQFGIHQCSGKKKWTKEEVRLFHEIGRRISDGLSSLLMYRERAKGEAENRAIVNAVPDLLFRVSKEGIILDYRKPEHMDLIMPPEQFLGKPISEVMPEKFIIPAEKAIKKALRTKEVETFEYDLILRGQLTYLEGRAIKLSPDEVLVVIRDITGKKLAEMDLQKSNSLLSAIIQAAPTAIFDLDLEGKVRSVWNPAAERMLGWKADEVLGQHFPSVPAERKEEFQGFQQIIKEGKSLNGLEVHRTRRDGTSFDYSFYASPLYDKERKVSGSVSVLVDITERKKADREIKQMNRALRLLGNSNQVLIHSTDEMSLYNEICRNITETAGYFLAWVGLIENNDPKTLRPVAQISQHKKIKNYVYTDWQKDDIIENIFDKSARTGETCIMHDIPLNCISDHRKKIADLYGYKSVIALPLINDSNTLGVLGIYSGETEAFHEKEVEILKELADDVAFGISTLRARDKRNQAEEALRASEERFSTVFHYSPIAIAIMRLEDGCIIDVNKVFIDTSGYSRDEIIGRTTAELGIYNNPDDRDALLQMLEETGSIDSYEFEIRTKAGDIRKVLSAVTYIVIKEVNHYLALILDITEKKKSEEKLNLLSKALEATANSILITDKDSTIIWANNAFSLLTGYSLDEAIGKNPRQLVYSGIHSTEFYQHMWNTILGGNVWHGEIINKRKNGTLYDELLTITPVRDENNEIRHFIAVKQDISSQKKAEEELRSAKEKAEESNRLKSAFLATMNHELRTPLNHIIGFSDLMRSGAMMESVPKYAEIIHKSSRNLLEIIEDIFELALAEQSELKLRLQTFKCLDLFLYNKSVLNEILEISGKRDQIKLVFNADNEMLLQNITADRTKINQVLINLFKNAVKFTKTGKIEFGLKKEDAGWLNFYVEDTGIGIPESMHEKIFDFFRQVDDSDTREYGGVGIGLAISKKIAEVMKGSLTIESRQNKGSTFYFRIPVALTGGYTQFKGVKEETGTLNLHGMTIIIAEDDPVSMDLIKKFLLNTEAKLIGVTNGLEVIDNLNINPDIILMDLNMPIMDGYSATRLVKSKRPDIPVIAITAYALPEDQNKARAAGCDGIVSKPVQKNILFAELKEHLRTE